MKGDRVEVVVDTGDGGAKIFDITATRAGRRVDVTTGRTMIEVAELTRSGQPVRVGRFLAARVIALVEHPAEERDPSERQRRRRPRVDQEETLL